MVFLLILEVCYNKNGATCHGHCTVLEGPEVSGELRVSLCRHSSKATVWWWQDWAVG